MQTPMPNTHTPHSILWHAQLVDPAVSWLLSTYAEPVYGTAATEALRRGLGLLLHGGWLLPVYIITLIVSCIW